MSKSLKFLGDMIFKLIIPVGLIIFLSSFIIKDFDSLIFKILFYGFVIFVLLVLIIFLSISTNEVYIKYRREENKNGNKTRIF